VQLAEQGEVGPGGGPAGDLYVELHVVEHDVFVRRGRDLLCTVTLPMTAAALGATIALPTLESDLSRAAAADAGFEHEPRRDVAVEIRPGTQSGTDVVVPGYGVPALRGGDRGDIVVRVIVETPTRLDDRQQDLLRQLAVLRGEESPDGQVSQQQKSVFNRLRGAFGPR
jgi:molecular chaperone DnaJ